ncbi:pentatricopeptide repeat-containing protein At2g01390-like [Coffea arabica]|uniref:Pentatricopeptide repeat-containing protein At2g01390-like n=1 Tax=Coffea arabica TaxID=13443 RepID=A0A6P6TIL0_COFAR|nr:pentatricopeptide repeat-containing protein At2g01390-like [Coffea arabica]
MFTSHGSSRFLRKFQCFVVVRLDRPNGGYCKITTDCMYSSPKHEHPEPVRQNSPKTKKSSRLINKRDAEPKTYMRDTITKISNILRYSTWDSAKDQLEGLAIKWDSFTVNQALKTHPPMEKTWLFFNWAAGLKGFKHDRFTYTTMLDIFGEAGRLSSMKYVFQQMQEKGIKIDVVTYTSLLHWLSNDGDVDGAINLWLEMRAKGCHPTVVSYTAYMKILFDHNRVKEGVEVYKEMLQAGCKPNCHTYTVLMEHLANAGRFKEVMEIFSNMQKAGVPPDKATCNILVRKCCSAKNIETMQQILQYMREKALVLRIGVYREALETLMAAGENDMLLKQVNNHLSVENIENVENNKFVGFTGDNISSLDRALVLHLSSKQNLVAIDCLLADLRGKSIKLDSGVISLIIEVNCSHCRQVGALTALEYSVELDIEVERTAYLVLLGLLIRTNSLANVVDVVYVMARTGVSLGTHLSALVIYRLGCARELGCAVKVFGLLPDEQRSTTTYTALIAAYFSAGDVDKGLKAFETMKRLQINVALGTYRVLITGLEKSGQVHKLDTYRKEKKILQGRSCPQDVSSEEMICNLLFAGDFLV